MVLKTMTSLLIGIFILTLSACSPVTWIPITGGDQTLGGEAGLATTRWKLVFYGQPGSEISVLGGSEVTLQFDHDGQAGGYTGCSMFSAHYEVSTGNQLSLTEVDSDLLPCDDDSFVEQEKQVLEALRAAERFELYGESLVIHYAGGVLSFLRMTAPPPNSVHI